MRYIIGQWLAITLYILIAYTLWENTIEPLNLALPWELLLVAFLSWLIIQIILLLIYWLCLGPFMRNKEGNITGLDLMFWGIGVTCYDIALSLTSKFFFHRITPLPLLKLYGFKCGKGASLAINTELVDPNLIIFGDNCRLGFNALVSSHIIEGKYLVRKKVVFEDNVEIGARTIVAPGAYIEENVIVGAMSFVPKNVHLKKNAIYCGVPVRKIRDIEPKKEENEKNHEILRII